MPRLNAINPKTTSIDRYILFFIEVLLCRINKTSTLKLVCGDPDSIPTYLTIKANRPAISLRCFRFTLTSRQRHRLSSLNVRVFEQHDSHQSQRRTADADRYAHVTKNREQW